MFVQTFCRRLSLLAVSALLLSLVACGQTITTTVLGPVSVAVTAVPNTIEPGPCVLHVQVSTADGQRPAGDAYVKASARTEAQYKPLQVIPVPTPGASEIHLQVSEHKSTEILLEVMGPAGPLGTLRYQLLLGQKGIVLME